MKIGVLKSFEKISRKTPALEFLWKLRATASETDT